MVLKWSKRYPGVWLSLLTLLRNTLTIYSYQIYSDLGGLEGFKLP